MSAAGMIKPSSEVVPAPTDHQRPQLDQASVAAAVAAAAAAAASASARTTSSKRNRTFIDPVSEVPRLEDWFLRNSHPTHQQICAYTEELNKNAYRAKFPKLEHKNIQVGYNQACLSTGSWSGQC